jgi:hypothetical protein
MVQIVAGRLFQNGVELCAVHHSRQQIRDGHSLRYLKLRRCRISLQENPALGIAAQQRDKPSAVRELLPVEEVQRELCRGWPELTWNATSAELGRRPKS